MTTFLADFEVMATRIVPPNDDPMTFCHPNDEFSVQFKLLSTDPLLGKTMLSANVIFECDNISDAPDIAEEHLRLFLDMLSFVTNAGFLIRKLIRVVDWTRGIESRECIQFNYFPVDRQPFPALQSKHLDSVATLLARDIPPAMRRVLKWFTYGLNAARIDEQFQYFWFAVEILAELNKTPSEVSDKCARCRSDLYCPECDKISTHRPYPKQAIKQLFHLVVRGEPEVLFRKTNKVRNHLMHGLTIDEIETKEEFDVERLADALGHTVWTAILSSLFGGSELPELEVLLTNRFFDRYELVSEVRGTVKTDPEPEIDAIPLFEVEIIQESEIVPPPSSE